MNQPKEYYAFISYKREDEKWAKWLQHKLEHYRFPTNLNGRTGLPKNIRPIFRDVTDLSPEPLEQAINNALIGSEWLIVICSPRSAKSPWVCKEAQSFIDLGRADHIIPFVIEGNPFSNDIATECYPEALLNLTGSKELLAANINEMGRDAAIIKVIARMFNLKFDVLWQRHEKEKRLRRLFIICGVLLFAIIATIIAVKFINLSRDLEATIGDRDQALTQVRKDSVVLTEHLQRITRDSLNLAEQRDSIRLQYDVIERTNRRLAQTQNDLIISNTNLKNSNILLEEEKEQVKRENWHMMLNQSKAVAARALELLNQGDAYTATLLALEVLPKDMNNPDRPWTKEADEVLRKACAIKFKTYQHEVDSVYKVYFDEQTPIAKKDKDGNLFAHDKHGEYYARSIGKSIYIYNQMTDSVVLKRHIDPLDAVYEGLDIYGLVMSNDMVYCTDGIYIYAVNFITGTTKICKGVGFINKIAYCYDEERLVSYESLGGGNYCINTYSFSYESVRAYYLGKELYIAPYHDIICLPTPRGDMVYTYSRLTGVEYFDFFKGETHAFIRRSFYPYNIICFSKDNCLSFCLKEDSLAVFNNFLGTKKCLIPKPNGEIRTPMFSDNNKYLYFILDNKEDSTINLLLWDMAHNDLRTIYEAKTNKRHTVTISNVEIDVTSNILKFEASRRIYCYDIKADQMVLNVDDRYGDTNLRGLALWCFNQGTDLYLIESEDRESVMHIDSRRWRYNQKTINGTDYYINDTCVIDSVGKKKTEYFLVASTKDGEKRILRLRYLSNKYDISPDGKRIAIEELADNYHRIINVYNTDDGVLVGSLDLTDALFSRTAPNVECLMFSEDNNYISITAQRGKNAIWNFPPIQDVIVSARERCNGCKLTTEQKKVYLLE